MACALGCAIMDLRYRDGGYAAQVTAAGGTYLMQMEFAPMDVTLPVGHALCLTLMETCEDDASGPYSQFPVYVDGTDASELALHTVDRPAGHPAWIEVLHSDSSWSPPGI